MKRGLCALLAAALLAACGSTAHPSLWLTSGPAKRAYSANQCVSAACSPWSVTLNWRIPSISGRTGYHLFRNGTQAGSSTSSSFRFEGSECGATVTLGVEAYNSASTGPLWTTSYTSPACPSNSLFPVKVSSNGRYLETASGKPWLMVGDSPWSVIGNLSESKAQAYFADREPHGFNAVLISLLCDRYEECASDGDTYDGIAPFTGGCGGAGCPAGYNLADPDASYFTRAHDIVAAAKADGVEVVLDPIPTDGCERGWEATLKSNGNGTTGSSSPDYQYGVYLGNEFKDLPNIIWQAGNDFQCFTNSAIDADALAVEKGIQSTDPSALQTMELAYCSRGGDTCIGYSSLDDTTHNWTGVLALNEAYSYSPQYAEDLHAYNQSPTMPTILGEANYEGERNIGTDGCAYASSDPLNCRLAEWWTMTSGATGQLYGGPCYGGTNSTRLSSCDTRGVEQLAYQTNLLENLGEWYNLVPDQRHALVIAGYGTCPTTGSIVSVKCVTDAETPDQKLALAYFPDPGGTFATITVNLGHMAKRERTTARWFDPTDGDSAGIAGSPFADSGTHTFTPPGRNSEGDSDWVLVLQVSES